MINLSLVMTDDNDAVRAAVAGAVAAGVVVVAAAGNNGAAGQGNPTPYPAAYPEVIGVGAITAGGVRAEFSQHGDYVDIAAAGDGVTVAAPGGGHRTRQGTSFAAPYVSATAALILQRFPGSTPAQVQRRLIATADPAPGGGRSDAYGYGLLNPYRALTETLGPPVPPVTGAGRGAHRRPGRAGVAGPPHAVAGPGAAGRRDRRGHRAAGRDRRGRAAPGRRRGWRPAGQDSSAYQEPARQA